jgi:hypothetical protein
VSSTPINIESSVFCEAINSTISGVNSLIIIIPYGNIAEVPNFQVVPEAPLTDLENTLSIDGYFVCKTGYPSFELDAFIEKNSLIIKGSKGAFNTSLSVVLQNTLMNRAILGVIRKKRFFAIVKDLGTKENLLLGRNELQLSCRINPDSINIEWGVEFSSDKNIMFDIEAKVYQPLNFLGGLASAYTYTYTALYNISTEGTLQYATGPIVVTGNINNVLAVRMKLAGGAFQELLFEINRPFMGTPVTPLTTEAYFTIAGPDSYLVLTNNSPMDLNNPEGVEIQIIYKETLNINP